MSQQGPFTGYPDDGQPGYPQQYSQPLTAPPQYVSPGQYPAHPYYQQHPGAPASGVPMGAPQPGPAPRSLKLLISLCVVLALAFAGSAYFFFFSGDAPSEVVGQYITHAQDEDFAGAREYTAEEASQGVKLRGTSEDMETMRRWFGKDSMSWTVREESTSGSKSIVTVDKILTLPNYEQPVDMRWDYRLKREAGNWRIERIKIMSIVEDGIAAPGDCMLSTGFTYEAADCSSSGDGGAMVTVTDAVDSPDDCPNPTGPAAETTKKTILCLEEQAAGNG